jgi:signal transduction histidine kinase
LESQVVSRTKELAALNAVAAVVSRSLELQQVLTNALDKTLEIIEMEAGGIYLLQEDNEVLVIAAHQGLDTEFVGEIDNLAVGEGFSGRVVLSGEPLVVQDLSTDPRLTRPAVREKNFHAMVTIPLVSRAKVLGTLFVATPNHREFSQQEIDLLTSIGGQVGVAVENARLYEQAQQVAVVEERQRLARELHDSVTQSLHGSTLLAEAGQRLAKAGDLERTRGYFSRLGEISQQALKEMRLLVYELRPYALREVGLIGALQQRIDSVEKRAGVEAQLFVEGEIELPEIVEDALFRIAQEALNNALKYAKPASVVVTIRVEGETPDQQVILEVVDDGVGFDTDAVGDTGGIGLVGMRERTEKLGGNLVVYSIPGKGTSVKAIVDLREEKHG